jgi:hypothetical protein
MNQMARTIDICRPTVGVMAQTMPTITPRAVCSGEWLLRITGITSLLRTSR